MFLLMLGIVQYKHTTHYTKSKCNSTKRSRQLSFGFSAKSIILHFSVHICLVPPLKSIGLVQTCTKSQSKILSATVHVAKLTVNWVSALRLSSNKNGDGWMSGLPANSKVKFAAWSTRWRLLNSNQLSPRWRKSTLIYYYYYQENYANEETSVKQNIITLGVVGVDRGTSETMRRTSNKRKSGSRGIFGVRKARPTGPSREPTFGLCFRGKALKEANGNARARIRNLEPRPVGPSRRAHFWWRLTKILSK